MCYWFTHCSLRYTKLESWIVDDERLKMRRCCCLSYTGFRSSSHSSFTLIPPSISQFCITVHSGFVSRSSICQHPPVGWQTRLGPGDRHQTWDAGLGSPNVCARIGAGLLRDKKKGLPAMINGYLRINTQVRRGGREGEKRWITLSSSISLFWSSH